jgi:2-keto-4-pentenoate hydratase/2-oxohepta-3-ene-1,7-dioic acid hydratase in catechol pathway
MKIICVGRNYLKHIKEMGNDIPTEPTLFMKPDTSLLLANKSFKLPDFSNDLHYEVEIVLKIDKTTKNVSIEQANDCFSEITLGIDFTARDLQNKMKNSGTSWEIAKAFDDSAVVGEFYPKDFFGDVEKLDFRLEKNGETVQKSNAEYMIFDYARVISFASKFFTLNQGDLIFTGTPSGVGPVKKGDTLTGFIQETQIFKTPII